jgi:protein-tyrosine-phosphatase
MSHPLGVLFVCTGNWARWDLARQMDVVVTVYGRANDPCPILPPERENSRRAARKAGKVQMTVG